MKKLFTFVVLAAMLLVSCVKEQKFVDEIGDQTSVHFTVAAGLATKAESNFATGTGVDALAVQAFIKDGDGNFQKTNATVTIAEVPGSSPKEWDVDMKLAKNREYKLAFFAYKSAAAVYDVTNLSAVAVDYENIAANSDDADAFCAGRYIQVSGAISETVVLYRPLAQINVGTNDLDEYKNSTLESMQDITIQVTADAVPNTLNVIGANPDDDGVVAATVSGEQTVAFERVDILDVEDELIEGYDYLSMAYVLADKEKETMTFTIDMDFGDEATAHDATSAEHICKIEVTNLPYQANYKTNIFGQLLTGNLHYDVEISPEFETPDFDKEIAPGFESVAELNAYFAKFETNADNGNVDPEEVILNGVSDGDVISLPKTAENLVIRVNAVCDGTVTIQYAEGAEEATQKPENIYLYFKNLGTLVLKTPDSHVELLSGSVLGAATVYTNGDTFVIQQGAKVGELEVKEGNADVAGEATTVTVKAANADEKIEVTVQKTAQVETINLETPADVIVEQPKDNIDKDATDNKVCVNVGANAGGSSATAQNGGDIYVNAIADCAVASEDEESSAYVSIADGVEVDTDGEVEVGFIYVAQVGDEKYTSLQKAFDAVQPGTPAEIVVLQDIVSSAGVFLAKGEKEINLDLAGHIVSFFGPAVGSTGTATQGFHLEKGNIVKISNGKVALDEGQTAVLMLIQNYCNLTLTDVDVDGTNLPGNGGSYVMSNNCGEVLINGATSITANAGDYAFDVCWAPQYYPAGTQVTVNTTGVIKGKIQVDLWGTFNESVPVASSLEIQKGIFDLQEEEFEVEDFAYEQDMIKVIGGYYRFDTTNLWFSPVPEGYCTACFSEGPYEGWWQVTTVAPFGDYSHFDYPIGGMISEPGFW